MTDATNIEMSWGALLGDPRLLAVAAAAQGAALHLVGGAVRDAALGRPVNDLDFVVADGGQAIAERLAAATGARLVALGGERFGALRLVAEAHHIDLWDLQGGSLVADLWRRDFTVNAVAISVPDGAITDPTGGETDLEKRLLRATRAQVFAEDPVRVLRLARLATTLPGFAADPASVAWARAATPKLDAMPHERLRVEIEVLLSQTRFAPTARWCDELELATILCGATSDLADATPRALPTAERLDRWRDARSARSGNAFAPAAQEPSSPDSRLPLHWALLVGSIFSPGAAAASRLRAAAKRGLMTQACRDAALRLLVPAWQPPVEDGSRRRWLHAAGPAWRDALALRASLARSEVEVEAWRCFEAVILTWPARVRAGILDPPALISGRDVQELLGVAPGPAVGAALARVRRAQVEGELATRAEAEALLRAESGLER